MKNVLTAVFVLMCLFTDAQAQTKSLSLNGTWNLSQLTMGDSLPATPQQKGFIRFKIFSPTHFTVLQMDARTNEILGALFGTYKVANGVLTETILNESNTGLKLVSKTFTFKFKLQPDGTLLQEGDINGTKAKEKWTKFKE
ncbi:hypothetical protein [Rufibacter aurantiacus]|uniref:hypothetical protein n=1 Tax=Rufibacter aurantiacus TaxID=2817374 RepID=UPI001B30587D|nr:hypothetical protein [Rufibacter aurantiacus]